MIDAFITAIYDADWARKYPRIMWSSMICSAAFLISLMYCTEFGFWLLDAIDTQSSNISLIFIVWAECMSATVLYRSKDVIGQVGMPAFLVHNIGFLAAKAIGLIIAHTVSPGGGAGAAFGIYFACVGASLVMAKTPDSIAPRFFGRNVWLNKLWWMGLYSVLPFPSPPMQTFPLTELTSSQGNQLRRDLNVTVAPPGTGNWNIPWVWPIVLRYFAAPVLAIILSFGYPAFIAARNDPLHIFCFFCAHLVPALVIASFIVPRMLNPLVPVKRREEGNRAYAPQVLCGLDDIRVSEGIEAASSDEGRSSDSDGMPVGEKYDGKKDMGLGTETTIR